MPDSRAILNCRLLKSLSRASLALCLLPAVVLGSCQRAVSPEQRASLAQARASYPWDQPHWKSPTGQAPAESQSPAMAGEVELPSERGRGPQLSSLDTFDPGRLAGTWLLVCTVAEEKVSLREPDSFTRLQFNADGTAVITSVLAAQVVNQSSGTWEKSAAGVLALHLQGGQPGRYYCEMFGDDFTYLWTYEMGNGLWLVRQPDPASPQPPAQRFVFSSGEELRLTAVRGMHFEGVITGPTQYEVSGGFGEGVFAFRWVDKQHNAAGYGALVPAPDGSIRGVGWLDDYEAPPFSNSWSGKAATDAPPPAAASQPPQGSPA